MFFWDVVRRRLVVGYRRFGTIRRSFADIYLRLCIAVVFYNITFCVCVCVCVCVGALGARPAVQEQETNSRLVQL